jgi:hypothetical protein
VGICSVKQNLFLKLMKKIEIILALFILGLVSCQMDSGLSNEEAQKAILGKWELVSYGEKENDMTMAENVTGNYREFLPDGTWRDFLKGYVMRPDGMSGPEGDFGHTHYYTIDANYLKFMTSKGGIDGYTDCYKYTFYDKNRKLRLIKHPLQQRDTSGEGVSYIFITNILNFEKK